MDQKIVKPFGNLVFEQKWVICTALSKKYGLSAGSFSKIRVDLHVRKLK